MTYSSFVKNGKKMTLGKYENRPIGLLIYRIKFCRRDWTSFVYHLACIQWQIYNFPALQTFFHDKKFLCMIYYSRKLKSKINKDKNLCSALVFPFHVLKTSGILRLLYSETCSTLNLAITKVSFSPRSSKSILRL